MALVEDLIDFDIIETQKENIQSLPQGRSAKALVSAFGPPSLFSPAPTPGATRNLNDAIRQEYELELIAISDSDDPLDIYDRYVKWTLNAYPSAQATPESQLRPLLERATKAFQTVAHYKNDPRYLKLWLHYVRFFSDAPKETFAYLARHSIGEGLALFYEEFAAWLEGVGRWTQAEEVYKLGIEREARPAERLLRKFGEFQHRFESRARDSDEPSSPALPTVRPALVAKLDPFALSTPRSSDPQAQRLPSAMPATSRNGRQKLAIFSDIDAPASTARSTLGDTSKGWDNIGSIQDRKKENVMEARPWAGETLKVGKKIGGPPKMMVFKDESMQQKVEANYPTPSVYTDQQQIVNPRTGKTERVFVNLDAVYPNRNDPNEEYSFEELRARHRGWLDRDWSLEKEYTHGEMEARDSQAGTGVNDKLNNSDDVATAENDQQEPIVDDEGADYTVSDSATLKEGSREGRSTRPRRKKIMEVKAETQTIKTNLESPTGPKLRRKASVEPTMTINTRAATDDILDIFNQPLRNLGPLGSHADSGGESDYDDDDYTSAGESTGTGRISGTTSEFGDETGLRSVPIPDVSDPKSVSEWSEFTASKHVPKIDGEETEDDATDYTGKDDGAVDQVEEDVQAVITPVSPRPIFETEHTKYIPIPPEDFEAPSGPYRDPQQVSQNRLPFMTPIVEKTESSIGLPTVGREKDYFNSKTPSRRRGDATPLIPEVTDNLLSSPFQEIINEAKAKREKKFLPKEPLPSTKTAKTSKGPIIKDSQCNPVDPSIRTTILASLSPPISSLPTYHDHRPLPLAKAPDLRKFVRALAKISKNSADRTTTNLSLPPTLHFPSSTTTYSIKRELGKGAFAPVYLAEETSQNTGVEGALVAIKAEDPPTAWEFYIMSTAHTRLISFRAAASLLRPLALHLFADEGYLLETYHPQPTLLDAVNLTRAAHLPSSTSPSPLGLEEPLAMFFAVELLRAVESLHSVGLLHGDLKADNCLIRLLALPDAEWGAQYDPLGGGGWNEKGVLLIDWGRGIDMKAFRDDVGFIADWKTGRGDCVEMREMRPWTWQVDYWGVAAVVHVLLFGKEIADVVEKTASPPHTNAAGRVDALLATGLNGVGLDEGAVGVAAAAGKKYRLKEGLKRYWATDVWGAFFDALMNPGHWTQGEEGGKMPLQNRLREVRAQMEAWLVENGERKGLKWGLRRLEELVRGRK